MNNNSNNNNNSTSNNTNTNNTNPTGVTFNRTIEVDGTTDILKENAELKKRLADLEAKINQQAQQQTTTAPATTPKETIIIQKQSLADEICGYVAAGSLGIIAIASVWNMFGGGED